MHVTCCTFVLLLEMNGGSSISYLARAPCVPLFCPRLRNGVGGSKNWSPILCCSSPKGGIGKSAHPCANPLCPPTPFRSFWFCTFNRGWNRRVFRLRGREISALVRKRPLLRGKTPWQKTGRGPVAKRRLGRPSCHLDTQIARDFKFKRTHYSDVNHFDVVSPQRNHGLCGFDFASVLRAQMSQS